MVVALSNKLSAQELTKKEQKFKEDSISFVILQEITESKEFTFNATEQEFLGSSKKMTRGENYVSIIGDTLRVFMPFPNSFDPLMITETRNLQFEGTVKNYLRKVNSKKQCIVVKFKYKYLATTWEFSLSIEKDKTSTLWIRSAEGALIKFLGVTSII